MMQENWLSHPVKARRKDHNMALTIDSTYDLCITLDQTTIVSPPTKSSMRTTFALLKLPPELRIIVYEFLIQAGDLSILRVSKLISREAISLLSKVAILRINLGRPVIDRVPFPLSGKIMPSGVINLVAPDYIQHLDLRINMVRNRKSPIDSHFILFFSGNTVARKSCNITVQCGLFQPFGDHLEAYRPYQMIATLSGFEILTLRLEDCETRVLGRFGLTPDIYRDRLGFFMLEHYEHLLKFLAGQLGRGQFHNTVDRQYLRFWPSACHTGGQE